MKRRAGRVFAAALSLFLVFQSGFGSVTAIGAENPQDEVRQETVTVIEEQKEEPVSENVQTPEAVSVPEAVSEPEAESEPEAVPEPAAEPEVSKSASAAESDAAAESEPAVSDPAAAVVDTVSEEMTITEIWNETTEEPVTETENFTETESAAENGSEMTETEVEAESETELETESGSEPEETEIGTETEEATEVSVLISGKVEYAGELKAGQFVFCLKEVDEESREVEDGLRLSAKNRADGGFVFDEIVYADEGISYYEISQKNGGKTIDGIVYDDSVYMVKVTVTAGEEGFEARLNKTASELKFTNTCEKEEQETYKEEFSFEDSRVTITAIAHEGANLPENAKLKAVYLAPGSGAYMEAVAVIEEQIVSDEKQKQQGDQFPCCFFHSVTAGSSSCRTRFHSFVPLTFSTLLRCFLKN